MLSRQLLRSIFSSRAHIFHRYPNAKQCQPNDVLRRFHILPSNLAKIYKDLENTHAHQVLEQSLNSYQLFPINSELNMNLGAFPEIAKCLPEKASTDDVFDHFKTVCDYCRQSNTLISNREFREFVQQFCDHIHLLTDDQLKKSLLAISLLPQEPSVRSTNFVELWNTLDIECCRRIDKWQTDELLLICDAWYTLNLARIAEFVWDAMRKLGRRVIKMQPNQLVQTMFLCNVMRRSVFDMFDFEVNLAKCIKDMSLAELGVMSMGFFKTQTPIRNPVLINQIYERLMAELGNVDDITFVALLKILRYSSKLTHIDVMMKLLDEINKEKIEQINLFTCLHVALLGCELQCCHDEIIEKILNRFYNDIHTTRLKDLERIALVIALFNIHTPTKIEESLCQRIVESLRSRTDEIVKHPKCFTNCLHFLTLRGYYDKEMLSTALERRFLKHAAGSSLVKCRDIFNLDTFVKVNLQNDQYEGAQLADKYRKTMGKMLTNYIPERNQKFKLNATDNILLQMKEITDEILPHNQIKHILPNYERPDVVICYDRLERKSVAIADSCPENYCGAILTRDLLLAHTIHKDIATVAMVIAGWNNVVRDKNRHTGLFEMKLRQLELLGHKPVVIYWHEWRALETHRDRVNFVKRRLSTVINL